MYNTCIVGAGVTGLSLLLLLQEAGTDISKVVIIDPYYDGGDLARKWTAVQSNTPWSKTANSLAAHCPSIAQPQPSDATKTTPLVQIAHLLRNMATPALKKARQIQGTATAAAYNSATATWTITASIGGKDTTVEATKLILATGSEPRTMDLPTPSIPLEIALDPARLQHFIQPGQHVSIFGTMHSGTLVIRNAAALGATVSAYYNTAEPFYWSSKGAYDGIKEEAATIADDIVAGKIPVSLIPVQDTAKLIRSSAVADWVIYAMGFLPRETIRCSVDGVPKSAKAYNGDTGALTDIPSAWGFGVAYPNRAPDGIHWDVSVAAFLDHMKKQMAALI
jgi:hypothetical protein